MFLKIRSYYGCCWGSSQRGFIKTLWCAFFSEAFKVEVSLKNIKGKAPSSSSSAPSHQLFAVVFLVIKVFSSTCPPVFTLSAFLTLTVVTRGRYWRGVVKAIWTQSHLNPAIAASSSLDFLGSGRFSLFTVSGTSVVLFTAVMLFNDPSCSKPTQGQQTDQWWQASPWRPLSPCIVLLSYR